MAKLYTSQDIEFLMNNYPIHGSDYCANYLGRSRKSIIMKCIDLGIKFDVNNYYENIDRKVDHKQFIKIENKYTAYILGFIWADGCIGKKEIEIVINTKDLDNIKEIFSKTGEWRSYSYSLIDKRTGKKYNQSRIITKNQILSKYLIDNDFKMKSSNDCDKILSNIPDDLKSHFFRGYFDGDGGFYYNAESSSYSCAITSTFNQNWTSIEKLFNSLGIKYRVDRKIKKTRKYSYIIISNKNDIDIFANYIYENWDNIGLKRKYDYYHSFSNNLVVRHIEKLWSDSEIDYLLNNYNGKNSKEIAYKLNRTTKSIVGKLHKIKIKKYESFIGQPN